MRERSKYGGIRACHQSVAYPRLRRIFRNEAANKTPVHQHVKMKTVREARAHFPDYLIAVNAVKHFEDRVGAACKDLPCTDIRISDDRQHGDLCDPEAEKIGAAVTQEYAAGRVIYRQKASRRADPCDRQRGYLQIACLPSHQSKPGQN